MLLLNSIDEQYQYYGDIKDFISYHHLRNPKDGTVYFKANVEIETQSEFLEITGEILITFAGYNEAGTLQILSPDLDPYVYPQKFKVEWDKFEFVDSYFLKIIGTHTQNSRIGNYLIKITPV